jgi:hypothetical protein
MLVASSRERFEDFEVQIRPGRTCSFHRVFVPVAPSLQDLNLSRNDAKYKKPYVLSYFNLRESQSHVEKD